MSERKEGVSLASLAINPEFYRQAQESLWKAYGSKENWEEMKAMTKQIILLEKVNAAQEERIRELEEQNGALVQEWLKRTADEVH